MKAFDIDVGFGVIQPQIPSILAVVAADGRKRGNEFQKSIPYNIHVWYMYIYIFIPTFAIKNQHIYIIHGCYGYHNRNFSLTDLNSSESDPWCRYSWVMAVYFHSATVPPKKQSQPHEKWTQHFQQKSPPGVEWPQIGCVFFFAFFLLNFWIKRYLVLQQIFRNKKQEDVAFPCVFLGWGGDPSKYLTLTSFFFSQLAFQPNWWFGARWFGSPLRIPIPFFGDPWKLQSTGPQTISWCSRAHWSEPR